MIMTNAMVFVQSVRGIIVRTAGKIWSRVCMTNMMQKLIRVNMTGTVQVLVMPDGRIAIRLIKSRSVIRMTVETGGQKHTKKAKHRWQ